MVGQMLPRLTGQMAAMLESLSEVVRPPPRREAQSSRWA